MPISGHWLIYYAVILSRVHIDRIILPFTLLRRLDGVLDDSKEAVLAQVDKVQQMNISEEAQKKLLLRATADLPFFNISKMDLSKLGESGIKDNLESYIQSFSKDAREIFEYFNFYRIYQSA